jgi:hypothetical protein
MKNLFVLFTVLAVMLIAGCIGESPTGQAGSGIDTTGTPYVTFSHPGAVYMIDYPENWQSMRVPDTDLIIKGDVFNGYPTQIVIDSAPSEETDVELLVTQDALAVKSVVANFRFLEDPATQEKDSTLWGQYCYTRFDGQIGIDIDTCNAITLCNGNIVYVSLSASSGKLDSGRTELEHMLHSFACIGD